MNDSNRGWNDERNQAVMRAVLSGRAYLDVSLEFKVSVSRVKDILIGCAERGYFKPEQKRMWGIYRRLFGRSTWDRVKSAMHGAPGDERWQAMLKSAQRVIVEKRKTNYRESNPFRDAQIIGCLHDMTPKQVAEQFGLDVQRIYQIRKKHERAAVDARQSEN